MDTVDIKGGRHGRFFMPISLTADHRAMRGFYELIASVSVDVAKSVLTF